MLVYPGHLQSGQLSKLLLVYSLIPSPGCVLIYSPEILGQVATLFCQQLKRRGLWASAEGLNVKKPALPPSHPCENHPLGLEASMCKWWREMKKASIVKKNKTLSLSEIPLGELLSGCWSLIAHNWEICEKCQPFPLINICAVQALNKWSSLLMTCSGSSWHRSIPAGIHTLDFFLMSYKRCKHLWGHLCANSHTVIPFLYC